jgi:hypothetical protein
VVVAVAAVCLCLQVKWNRVASTHPQEAVVAAAAAVVAEAHGVACSQLSEPEYINLMAAEVAVVVEEALVGVVPGPVQPACLMAVGAVAVEVVAMLTH